MAALRAWVIVLLFANVVSAQFRVDTWTSERGLPQNSVHAIVQTRDGYLWLATFGGLVRFDGVAFTIVDGDERGRLKSNRILSLHEGRSGALWIGTEQGGLSRYFNGTITTYTSRDGLPSDNVRYIHEDRAGRLWLATVRGLALLENGRFTTFTTADGLPTNVIWQIAEDRAGTVLIATGEGLVQYRDGKLRVALSTADGLPDNYVTAVMESRDGSLWLGTGRTGVVHVDSGKITTYTVHHGLPTNNVRRLLEDRTGAIWVATDGGLARLSVNRIDPPAVVTVSRATGLSDDVINALAEDREGNIWAGTNTGGLNRVKRSAVVAYDSADGLPGSGVVPITQDATGAMWIGMTCGGLARYRDGRFDVFTKKDGLPNDCVWSLLAARDGSIWIGTWGDGLARFKDGRFITYTPSNSGLSNAAVLALHEDPDGSLWIGTGGGLNHLENGVFKVYKRGDGVVADDVRFITRGRDGALWIGTSGGASRFLNGSFTNYTTETGLSHNFVRAIHDTADGAIWFGTYGGGLNRLKGGRFTHITAANGLFENIVSRILEDETGRFWMTGNKGITRVNRTELEAVADGRANAVSSVAYGLTDGMKSSECNGGGQPAGWRTHEGILWFPTARGVAVIDPRHIASSTTPPPVMVERVLINRAPVNIHSTVEVPPGASDLEIHFTGLSFSAPERVRFRYRLAGLDDDWTDAGTRRSANYSHLPPGNYSFTVTAANPDGVWNTAGATIQLLIVPPFYRTWWFTGLTGAAIVSLLLFAYERRIRGLTRARQAQESFSRRLIESQEAERKRIAAELHDSLSQTLVVIKNRAMLSLQTPGDHERAMEQLDEIADAATHAIDEVREISYNLRPYHLDRLGLTQAISAMLDKVSAAHALKVDKTLDPLEGLFPGDAEINIYRIVQEAVNNIVRHAEATEATVSIRAAGSRVAIAIADNGRGFTTSSGPPGRASGGGFGLAGLTERARLLGAELSIQSTPGQGTTIRIVLAVKELDGQRDPHPDRG